MKKIPKENFPERLEPGAPEGVNCTPGSIEQQLDMCEEGSLRGDEISHSRGSKKNIETPDHDPYPLDHILGRAQDDLSEADREGDEMSGDEHSSGMQGDQK